MASNYQYPTESLFVSLLRSDWDQSIKYIEEKSTDYDQLKTLVRRTGTGGYICWLLQKDSKESSFPAELIQFFRQYKEKLKIDNSYILGTFDKVLRTFLDEGIRVILLKGGDLLHRVYPSYDLRHLEDIDLLIQYRDLERAINSLQEIGFKVPTKRELNYYKKASYNIECWSKGQFPCLFEIHWDLSQKYRYTVDMEQVWDSCSQESIPEIGIVGFLKPEDLFIHLSAHLFHHSFHAQLKWHIDLKEILENLSIDMDEVLRKSQEWGCQYSLYYALIYLKKIFPKEMQNSVFQRFVLPKLRDYFISKYYSHNPIRLFDSQGKRYRERFVRTIAIDRKRDIFLFSFHRLIRNPWVRLEDD
jgi:hypothetical protein